VSDGPARGKTWRPSRGAELQRDCRFGSPIPRVVRLPATSRTGDDRPATPQEVAMQLTVRTLCLIIAVILFVIAAIGVDVRGVSLLALGLAFFAAAFIVPDTIVGRR
jgi:hypothetical protein